MHHFLLLFTIFLLATHAFGSPATSQDNEVIIQIKPGSTRNKRITLFGGPSGAPIRKAPPPLCNVFDAVLMRGINEGISTLKKWGNKDIYCKSPPTGCQQLVCSYAASIQLCNENNFEIALHCGEMATYAEDIVNSCKKDGGVKGQLFDANRYNVIIRHINRC